MSLYDHLKDRLPLGNSGSSNPQQRQQPRGAAQGQTQRQLQAQRHGHQQGTRTGQQVRTTRQGGQRPRRGPSPEPEIHLVKRRPEHSAKELAEMLIGNDHPDPPPVNRVLVSDVSPENARMLVEVADRLRSRLRTATPVLVAIPEGRQSLKPLVEAWDLTIAVRPGMEHRLPDVVQFLPDLCQDHETLALASLASARVLTVSVANRYPDVQADQRAVKTQLRDRRGEALDEIAGPGPHQQQFPRVNGGQGRRPPDRIAIAAPGKWGHHAKQTLRDFGPIMGVQDVARQSIDVAHFVFADRARPSTP